MSRCTGHCCMAFRLNFSPEDLATMAAAPRPDMRRVPKENRADEQRKYDDLQTIAAMVIPLGRRKNNPVNTTTAEYRAECQKGAGYYYTCIYFDGDTRDCTIHKERPTMCSDYPYGKSCEYKSCTWKDAVKATTKPETFKSTHTLGPHNINVLAIVDKPMLTHPKDDPT